MATLNSVLKSVVPASESLDKRTVTAIIGSANSAQNKIAEVIISNTSDYQIEYQLFITRNEVNYPITPSTRLLVGEVHTKPMSTFINSSDTLKINISAKEIPNTVTPPTKAEAKVDTITSIIEL